MKIAKQQICPINYTFWVSNNEVYYNTELQACHLFTVLLLLSFKSCSRAQMIIKEGLNW